MKLTKRALTVLLASTVVLTNVPIVYANGSRIEQQQYTGTICIDYGHYYGEAGKRSGDGTGEIVFNMGVGKKVVEILNEEVPYVRVLESNPVGEDTTISDRAMKAEAEGAEFMVSLHMNAASHEASWQDRVNGTHIMFREDVSEEHKELAKAYLNHYADSMGYRKHCGTGYQEVEPNKFGLLDYGSENNFAVFIHEMQFMDNKEYADFFLTEEGQDKAARAIADAIEEVYIDKYIEKPVVIEQDQQTPIEPLNIEEVVNEEENKDISFIDEEQGTLSLDKLILHTQEELKEKLINESSVQEELKEDEVKQEAQNVDVEEVVKDELKEVAKEEKSMVANLIDMIRPKDQLSLDLEKEDVIVSERESIIERATTTINKAISKPTETPITKAETKAKQETVKAATTTVTSHIDTEKVNQFKEELKAGNSEAQKLLAKIKALNTQLNNN